jgi:hypothetical protein
MYLSLYVVGYILAAALIDNLNKKREKAASVAKSNEDLKALIANASTILGPGFFVPGRNYEIIRWLFESGFRIGWPANLMSVGSYQEPLTPFLPSLAY